MSRMSFFTDCCSTTGDVGAVAAAAPGLDVGVLTSLSDPAAMGFLEGAALYLSLSMLSDTTFNICYRENKDLDTNINTMEHGK